MKQLRDIIEYGSFAALCIVVVLGIHTVFFWQPHKDKNRGYWP